MAKSPPTALRSALYALRSGFLVRPLIIAFAIGTVAAVLSSIEERYPAIQAIVPLTLFPSHADPQVAQAILTTIATATMTVVSIVFAILLMTLTLASMQFSPRILINFVRDQVTQWTLGVFLGTFSYCIEALPAARSLPYPFVPVVTVLGAMALAPVCVGWLIYFIHHISVAISVNTIIDRIRREAELLIDVLMPNPRRPVNMAARNGAMPANLDLAILSRSSGYVRYVDIARLCSLARDYGMCVRLERRVGHFVSEGVSLLRVTRGDRMTNDHARELLAAIDIGPTRTMHQDVEFGIVQIVDIALRAVSPAVNDPTTAISCVDQLSCILIRWLSPRLLRVIVPWIKLEGLLDLAFEQIRHYAAGDAAVSLRLMRALADIRSTVDDPKISLLLLERGKRLLGGCEARLQEDDLERLRRRLRLLSSHATTKN